MGSLYFIRLAASGQQFGLVYFGHGVVAGADTTGIQYDGTYALEDGRFKGSVKIIQPVANQGYSGGSAGPELTFDWPEDLADGQYPAKWGGQAATVSLRKLRDLP